MMTRSHRAAAGSWTTAAARSAQARWPSALLRAQESVASRAAAVVAAVAAAVVVALVEVVAAAAAARRLRTQQHQLAPLLQWRLPALCQWLPQLLHQLQRQPFLLSLW